MKDPWKLKLVIDHLAVYVSYQAQIALRNIDDFDVQNILSKTKPEVIKRRGSRWTLESAYSFLMCQGC